MYILIDTTFAIILWHGGVILFEHYSNSFSQLFYAVAMIAWIGSTIKNSQYFHLDISCNKKKQKIFFRKLIAGIICNYHDLNSKLKKEKKLNIRHPTFNVPAIYL